MVVRTRILLHVLLPQNYSVMLVIPDFYDRVYVREFVNILLVSLGFKQICVQQVSRGVLLVSIPFTFQ